MNYYLNDVLTEMDPKSGTEEREKCKNLKVIYLNLLIRTMLGRQLE